MARNASARLNRKGRPEAPTRSIVPSRPRRTTAKIGRFDSFLNSPKPAGSLPRSTTLTNDSFGMSKAFTREENEGPDVSDVTPFSALPPGARNLMTPSGAERLRRRARRTRRKGTAGAGEEAENAGIEQNCARLISASSSSSRASVPRRLSPHRRLCPTE